MQLIANLSMLFTERPMAERFAAATRAGFAGCEIQWPYEHDLALLRDAAAGCPVVLVNAPARDPRGAIGRATDAGLRAEFRAGLDEALRYGEALNVAKINVPPGPPPPGQSDEVTEAVYGDNLRLAVERFGAAGIETVIEPINPWDVPGMWLDELGKALGFLRRLGEPRVRLQFDLYHMARTEPDLAAAIATAGPLIGHVQFADTDGRHEPGTGGVDFAAAFAALARTGYDGAVAAEYRPAGRTEDGLGWMRDAEIWLDPARRETPARG